MQLFDVKVDLEDAIQLIKEYDTEWSTTLNLDEFESMALSAVDIYLREETIARSDNPSNTKRYK